MKKNNVALVAVATLVAVFGFSSLVQAGAEAQISVSPLSAVVKTGKMETIKWNSANYPADANVQISLLRKLGNNPVRYTLEKEIVASTPNDGEFAWKPESGQVGENLSIEVSCATTNADGCIAGKSEGQFAIEKSSSMNLAAVGELWDSIILFIKSIFY